MAWPRGASRGWPAVSKSCARILSERCVFSAVLRSQLSTGPTCPRRRTGTAEKPRGEGTGLGQHLLRQQIAAEGDTLAEHHRGKVAALRALAVGPGFHRGRQ